MASPAVSNVTFNVPPADLLVSFIERALKHPAANHPTLIGLHPPLRAAVAGIVANIGAFEKSPEYDIARGVAREKDRVYDARHGFAIEVLEAFTRHPDATLAGHAKHLLDLLYPEGLGAVTQAAFEIQAAFAVTYDKRLAQPRAQAAVAALSDELPKLGAHLAACVTAGHDLGAALEALDAFLVDKAGRPMNPALFAARTRAHRLLSTFVDVVESAAYPSDSPEDAKARTALIGPYRRFVASGRSSGDAKSDATPATPSPAAPSDA